MSWVILPLPTSCLQEAGMFSEYILGGEEDWDDKKSLFVSRKSEQELFKLAEWLLPGFG